VLERRDDGMPYARVAPDRIAGTISVDCTQAASPEETLVRVCYDVTSLGPEGARSVEEFQERYEQADRLTRRSFP